jgi:hypothetical protein
MSKSNFLNEYNNLLNQGISEIYAKLILAEKYKDIIDPNEIIEYFREENDNIHNAIVEGGFIPFHLTENNILGLSIDNGKKDKDENEDKTETTTKSTTEC